MQCGTDVKTKTQVQIAIVTIQNLLTCETNQAILYCNMFSEFAHYFCVDQVTKLANFNGNSGICLQLFE